MIEIIQAEETEGDCITTARKVLADFWNDGNYYSEDYHGGYEAGVNAVIDAIKGALKQHP